MSFDPAPRIAEELRLAPAGVRAVARLLEEGATVPFIARYRKEQTGGLDEVAIRAIGSLVDGAEATLYDSPAVARAKGSYRMLKVLRKAARGALEKFLEISDNDSQRHHVARLIQDLGQQIN